MSQSLVLSDRLDEFNLVVVSAFIGFRVFRILASRCKLGRLHLFDRCFRSLMLATLLGVGKTIFVDFFEYSSFI